MDASNRTIAKPSYFQDKIGLLGSLLFTAFFSLMATMFIGFAANALLLFTSDWLFWEEAALSYPLSKLVWMAAQYLLAGGVFALAWYGYWRLRSALSGGRQIRSITLHLLFAYLPLLALYRKINPVYNPMQMIPRSAGETRFFLCMAMSAVLLFPLYFILLYRLVLRLNVTSRRIIRLLLLCCLFALIGLALLPLLWQSAPRLYPELSKFPDNY